MLSLFGNRSFFDDDSFTNHFSSSLNQMERTLATDIQSDEKQIKLVSNIPGWDKKDINLSFDKGILTISGERKEEKEEKDEKEGTWHRIERTSGSFSRSFRLPDNVDLDKATSKLENGVLTTVIPKLLESSTQKSIQIN